jgi:endogenous inhibitor of DNA gyrase (YacG/DUF329 family)
MSEHDQAKLIDAHDAAKRAAARLMYLSDLGAQKRNNVDFDVLHRLLHALSDMFGLHERSAAQATELERKLSDKNYEVPILNGCPRCGAESSKEAETRCIPGCDECPMADHDDWGTALAKQNEMIIQNNDANYWRVMGEKIDVEQRAQQAEARYEYLRCLNVSEFADLFTRCAVMNLRFDDEVDKAIEKRKAKL